MKVTPYEEYPAKGRGTGGVRCHRFLKGEDVADRRLGRRRARPRPAPAAVRRSTCRRRPVAATARALRSRQPVGGDRRASAYAPDAGDAGSAQFTGPRVSSDVGVLQTRRADAHAAVDQHRDPPEHDAEHEQQPGDLVLRGVTAGQRRDEVGAGDRPGDRHHRRRHEVVVVDAVLAKHEHRDVHDREHAEQQQRGRPAERRDRVVAGERDVGDQPERERGGEDDRDPRGSAPGVHPAKHRREHPLLRHAVEQAAGHEHVDQRRVRHGEHRDERQEVDRSGSPAHRPRRPSTSGVSLAARSPTGTSATATIDTST